MSTYEFEEELDELSSTEEFLNYFEIEFDQSVVHVNRLHIMQRYHDYLEKAKASIASANAEESKHQIYRVLLQQAYSDFVESDAATEKVFKVFKMQEPQTGFVSVDQLLGQ
ncbi:nitrogenase-stabilizing/protective protein [Alteromonadaceae bacterium Bs31]|nr:nitrogenase-stabilizing/protective protein [Alteromonadaceae bacterium Bs31]